MTKISSSLVNIADYNSSATVIYVEDNYNREINDFIQSNYFVIVEVFRMQGVNFLYLPLLFKDEEYQQMIDYNHPHLNIKLQEANVSDIYKAISEKYNLSVTGSILIAINPDRHNQISGAIAIDSNHDIFQQFKDFSFEITERFLVEKSKNSGYVLFDIGSRGPELDIDNVGLDFDDSELEAETNKCIDKLIEKGSLIIIGKLIEKLQKVNNRLSRIFITNDYRIFLIDYKNKEVVMSPLPKTLFLLFLNHPEGILFKNLSEYEDELLTIYRNVTTYESVDNSIKSIKAITDPLNNSVNEKRSRIRASFLLVVNDEIAENYYITGGKGQLKRIILNRELVEYQ